MCTFLYPFRAKRDRRLLNRIEFHINSVVYIQMDGTITSSKLNNQGLYFTMDSYILEKFGFGYDPKRKRDGIIIILQLK